ncbi:low-density lipoprotein receptor class A domain-containing protein 2 isoform X2 [Engystomops pustulosus]|uniref:low-density lipoprotein receptor class A domain-containing protein 2 isoform X2 n=1 Tax=Engystomops pustulosus TaxID=76066 RepID=UPI003AFA6499
MTTTPLSPPSPSNNHSCPGYEETQIQRTKRLRLQTKVTLRGHCSERRKKKLHASNISRLRGHRSCYTPQGGLERYVRMWTLQPLPPLFLLMMMITPTAYSLETVSMVDFCGQTIRADGMIINSHSDSRKYYFVSVGTDCRLTMQAAALKDKVQFQFRFFLVYSLLRMSNVQAPGGAVNGSARASSSQEPTRPPGSHSDPCNAGSYVQFYDGKDHYSEPLGYPLCGKTLPRPVLSTGNYLTLRLVTRGQQPRVDFVGDFTSFRIGFNTSACKSEPYFPCHNGKCIPSSLVCDEQNIDNCGDGSDQATGPPANCVSVSMDKKAGARAPITSTEAPDEAVPPSSATVTDPQLSAVNLTCGSEGNQKLLVPDIIQPQQRSFASFLYLYIILGFVVGVALLFWCCWSPGWFIWRLSVCRFIPCCNSFCASCHLCTRSCILKDKTRPSKVTPQDTAPTVPV